MKFFNKRYPDTFRHVAVALPGIVVQVHVLDLERRRVLGELLQRNLLKMVMTKRQQNVRLIASYVVRTNKVVLQAEPAESPDENRPRKVHDGVDLIRVSD